MHLSAVHGSVSLQSRARPLMQFPPLQVSPIVQMLPSSHGSELNRFLHTPSVESQ
jgi:hypothetical protein